MVERTIKVHPHYKVLLTNTKESIIDTRNNLDESPEIILSEKKKRIPKGTHCMIPFIKHFWNDIMIEIENRLVIARA